MADRIDVDNPFYDNDASASVFGWDFQVNAAIFLFLKYLKQVDSVKVEGKYQDIELRLRDDSCIFAQAKSIQNGSNDYRKKKLEDAIISLVKTPMDYEKDKLLYVSNYLAPIRENNFYNNQIIELKSVVPDKIEFEKIIDEIIDKLKSDILTDENISSLKKHKYSKLVERLENMNTEDFLVCSIVPYVNTVQPEDKYKVIENLIQEKLTYDFNITSSNMIKYVKKILLNWQSTFLLNATTPDRIKEKTMCKLQLMPQIIAIISDKETDNLKELLTFELQDDLEDEYSQYYNQRSFYHDRFEFINKLFDDFKRYNADIENQKTNQFIREEWKKYYEEYSEFMQYEDDAQEYLIKRDLLRLLSNSKNIKKIIDGVKHDNT